MSGPRWEATALLAILVLALALRLWGLEQNGWGTEYHTAAVRSMAANWHNFFDTAFDPDGFISVDKPPIALRISACSRMVWPKRMPEGSRPDNCARFPPEN